MRRVFMTSRGEIKVVDFAEEELKEPKSRREHDLERLKKLTEFIKCKLSVQSEISPELVAEYNEITKRYPNE